MEEDDCDYGTPIGKVIKHINGLCKKPPFDNQLSEAIDLFHEKLHEQEKYLVNGIFKINFAESALFLQSCANLYGKKIDLLWTELLEFHTRLIKYDCDHLKEKGAPLNREVIDKLEERRNRYLRKKNFKLLHEEEISSKPAKTKIDIGYLIHENGNLCQTEETIISNQTEEEEDSSLQMWRDIEEETKEQLKISNVVYKQMTQTYRLKNYPILKGEDFDILDPEDGEFNTKYSRVPGWHHILHLLEYNNNGMLPDNNNLIAKLKLRVVGKIKFLMSHKIPFDTPFELYKNKYIEYRNNFLKEEAKRWQNMPLDTFEDFRKQLQVLAQLHEKDTGPINRCSIKTSSQPDSDKIEILDNSDEDSLFELTFSCNKEYMKSDLFVRLEKLSCDLIDTKLRQDSGIYDSTSGSDSETAQTTEGDAESEVVDDNLATNDAINTDINKGGSNGNINIEVNSDITNVGNTDASKDDTDVNNAAVSKDDTDVNNAALNKDVNIDVNSNFTIGNSIAADDKEDDDNFDTRSIVSDHDYCLTPQISMDIPASSGSGPNNKNNGVSEKTVEATFKKPLGLSRIIPKVVTNGEPKKKHQINKETENDESPPKRRKLSQKQLEVLRKSKITPVKFLKFEKFFSENYQPEDGEGEVPNVEYESDESDVENPDLDQSMVDNNCEPADDDDVRSIYSDHSYCMTSSQNSRNDSGFLEGISQPSSASIDETEKESQPIAAEETSLEEEYQRMVASLREKENENVTLDSEPCSRISTELELKEKERKESQARVQEWRDTINPILKNLKEHDFNIHEYGSHIIEGMEINESKPFSDMVQGKSSAEVVRYFIASLQLANTNNIEICGAKQGQLSNDTYKVKLLNKDRYHEHLDEYLAPSEETLAERLERVRAMHGQQENLVANVKDLKLGDKIYKSKRSLHDGTKKKLVIKLSTSVGLPQGASTEKTHDTFQHNKENCNTLASLALDKTSKGKSIIKRQTNSPQILNFDISLPCTSRHVQWSDDLSQTSGFDPQIPSTSAQKFSPPRNLELFERDQRHSPKVYGVSPIKRRRNESTEESFLERLVTTQKLNPDIQVHSTPNGPPPSKHMRISSVSKKSILF